MLGSLGADSLDGGAGEDVLVAGKLSFYDENTGAVNRPALDALMLEWARRDADYATRIGHLSGTRAGGLNGAVRLNAATVRPDGAAVDRLFGGDDRDWFLVGREDLVQDLNSGGQETVTAI